ncbi:MAG TPA: DUF445 family protein [Gemmatimonadaceae bacterium]|jgi:uncharacterized membrane protein YheB (UPF0754 family)|nr:DUF445 family protein [Gemmatimonadaceae bacterium]
MENEWIKFAVHVTIGTLAGGLSDTVAIWLLFNPKEKRFGIQGAIPKNHARMARSLGRTVGERLVTPGDLQSELARPELRAAFELKLAEVIDEIIESRDPLIDKVPPAVVTALEGSMTSYLPTAMGKLGSFLGQPTTRVKMRTALHGMFNRFVDDLKFHEKVIAKLMMTERKFDTVLDAIETDAVDQMVTLLDEPEIREEITRTIHDALLAYLQKPIAEIVAGVAVTQEPDAGRKLAQSSAPLIWEWIHAQLPSLVSRLDVQAMVERKVMAFSVDRVEEILRSVINNELRMIITTGYVLGALIGVCTFFISRAVGL